MKKLMLQTASFEYLERGFREWLDILGYCAETVNNLPNYLREFLHFLEAEKLKSIEQLTQKHIKNYHQYLQSRPNQRRGGGLSDKYILMHLQAIEKFLEYLHHKGIENVPALGLKLPTPQRKEITILTPEEIKLLFEAASRESVHPRQEAINARDKAMLVVYYSCGLRKTEGANLHIDDINFDTRILHVRKGKNYKQRFVPFNKTSSKYLEEYIYDHRPQLVKSKKESHLFISLGGKPTTSNSLYSRLKILQSQVDDIVLKEKVIGLHALRHSIATHLLQAGMSLEKIAKFLGHSSLDSTQIYTHLTEKTNE